jgi:hypothetical protein
MKDNKIIVPPSSETKQPSGPIALNRPVAGDLVATLQKLRAIYTSKIETRESEAEKVGLTEHLATGLIRHADELLGCWFAVKEEYEPLTMGMAGLLRRASKINMAISQQSMTPETSAAKANEPAGPVKCLDDMGPAKNIVPLHPDKSKAK